MKKIITCHCKNIKISVVFPEIITPVKCNCSICQRRKEKMAVVEKKDVKVLIGSEFIKSYKFHTKVAEHFFCSNCGIYTHHIQRRDTTKIGINLGCLEDFDKLKLNDQINLDGKNHPLDKK